MLFLVLTLWVLWTVPMVVASIPRRRAPGAPSRGARGARTRAVP